MTPELRKCLQNSRSGSQLATTSGMPMPEFETHRLAKRTVGTLVLLTCGTQPLGAFEILEKLPAGWWTGLLHHWDNASRIHWAIR